MTEAVAPLGYRVLVSRNEPDDKTEGGIILHDTTKTAEYAAETRGKIVAIGSKAWDDDEGSRCNVGDEVIIRKYSGAGVDTNKYGDVLVNDRDILARVH